MNKTKIIATLGPATGSKEKIVELIRAEMNVARINLSHGDRKLYIPVVCNVLNATTLFKNSQTVTIDGTTGHISYDRVSTR